MTRHEKVFIVEDDYNWQDTLSRLLSRAGCEVEVFADYDRALETILKLPWIMPNGLPVCIFDLNLGASNVEDNYTGLGLLALCKSRKIPTLVVSGFLTSYLKRVLSDEYGVLAVFDKAGLDEDVFVQAVEQSLKAPIRRMEFRRELQDVADSIVEYYKEAHTAINKRQQAHLNLRGRRDDSIDIVWRQEISKLDNEYTVLLDRLNSVDTAEDLNRVRSDVTRECQKWLTASSSSDS